MSESPEDIAEVLGYNVALIGKRRPFHLALHHRSTGAITWGKGHTRKAAKRDASIKAIAQHAEMQATLAKLPALFP
jgi:hypothetical protein